jgi:hypothetical protein
MNNNLGLRKILHRHLAKNKSPMILTLIKLQMVKLFLRFIKM